MSQRSSPTEAGELNRRVEEEKGREHNSGTSAEFGQKIGRSENLEGGNMRNRNDEPMTNIGSSTGSGREVREDESSRRSGSGDFGSSSGRSSGSGSMGGKQKESNKSSDDDRSDNRSWKDSSEGRH
ncbi:MAG TPA: hypothetical protein VFV49_13065 [Thermoanaerobaculia bacterium]|nr:hypothetical protein [Thermoanaerobaculia bacterium]